MSTHDDFGDKLDTIEVEDIYGFLKNNYVLIEVDTFMHDTIKKGVLDLYVDNTHLVQNYGVRHGTVVGVPERLISWEESKTAGMEWKTDIEIEQYDEIWFSGMMAHNATKLSYGERKFLLMNYEDLYVAKRGDEVICLNGNVIIERKKETKKALSYEEVVDSTDFGTIVHIGSKNAAYRVPFRDDCEELKQGMDVFIGGTPLKPLEVAPYLFFSGEKELYVCQNNEIMCYLEKENT